MMFVNSNILGLDDHLHLACIFNSSTNLVEISVTNMYMPWHKNNLVKNVIPYYKIWYFLFNN